MSVRDEKSRRLSPLDGVRVLLVDDDAMVRDVLGRLLVGFGGAVIAVAGVAEALDALPRVRPHVLVSDIDMPGENGYALIRRMRALPPDLGGQTPAVCLTGRDAEEDEAHALRAGFQHCLTKPVDARRLVTVVANLASLATSASTGRAPLAFRAWPALAGGVGDTGRPRREDTL
jgi:CheY-like chemotaxis protein